MVKIKIGNQNDTYTPTRGNATFVLEQGKQIQASGTGIHSTGAEQGVSFQIDGSIKGGNAGVIWGGQPGAQSVDISVGEHGQLRGGSYGVFAASDESRIENAGSIKADTAIVLSGDNGFVANSGHITASTGVAVAGQNNVIRNSGEISAEGVAVMLTGDDGAVVHNTGTMEGVYAVYGSDGDDRVVNTGKMEGLVRLEEGEDTFIFKKGSVGTIDGGEGNDTFVIRKAGADLVEASEQGYDTVKTSVSFELGDNFERLLMSGKKDIDGVGSDSDNWIEGNAGRNELTGGDGFDHIIGGRGNDILTGGLDGDSFHFVLHSGKDIVTDFEIGTDELHLGELKGVKDFDDMMAKHVDQHGKDVWITYGDDVVVLKNIDADHLVSGDFYFTNHP